MKRASRWSWLALRMIRGPRILVRDVRDVPAEHDVAEPEPPVGDDQEALDRHVLAPQHAVEVEAADLDLLDATLAEDLADLVQGHRITSKSAHPTPSTGAWWNEAFPLPAARRGRLWGVDPSSFLVQEDAGLRAIFETTRTIAVVGLSSNPARPSLGVARYLQAAGFRILPVNPNEREVLGVPAVASLADLGEPVDVVDVFRRSSDVGPVADQAIAIGAKVLWLQEGVIDLPSARRAHEAGLRVVMDRCMLREHRRLFGG